MKKVLLACALLAMAPAVVSAQTAATPQAATSSADQSVAIKRELNSHVTMMEAGVSRNTPEVVNKGIQAAMGTMQRQIAMEMRMIQEPGVDAAKAKSMRATIDQQNKIYADVKMKSVDANTNAKAIMQSVKDFMKTF